MNIKLIALGNRLMMDDSAALYAAEILKEHLNNKGIKVIIGETDIDYCLNEVENDDFLFILDATNYGLPPGSISLIPIELSNNCNRTLSSQHQLNFISALELYNKNISGYILGIEIENISLSLSLSRELTLKMNVICKKLISIIELLLVMYHIKA